MKSAQAWLSVLASVVLLASCAQQGKVGRLPGESAYEGELSFYRSSASRDFKAFAIDRHSEQIGWAWGSRHPRDAIQRALRSCRSQAGRSCRLHMVGPTLVQGMSEEAIDKVVESYYTRATAQTDKLTSDMTPLTAAEIEQLFSSRFVGFVTDFTGQTGMAAISPGGRLAVALDRQPLLGQQNDSGSWWTEDGKFCHRFRTWYDGQTNCARLVKDGVAFKAFDDQGVMVSKLVKASFDEAPEAQEAKQKRGIEGQWRGVATTTRKSGGWVCTPRYGVYLTISGRSVSGTFEGEVAADGTITGSDDGYQRSRLYDGRIKGTVAEGTWRVTGACSGSWHAELISP